jgi:hypothetical protein
MFTLFTSKKQPVSFRGKTLDELIDIQRNLKKYDIFNSDYRTNNYTSLVKHFLPTLSEYKNYNKNLAERFINALSEYSTYFVGSNIVETLYFEKRFQTILVEEIVDSYRALMKNVGATPQRMPIPDRDMRDNPKDIKYHSPTHTIYKVAMTVRDYYLLRTIQGVYAYPTIEISDLPDNYGIVVWVKVSGRVISDNLNTYETQAPENKLLHKYFDGTQECDVVGYDYNYLELLNDFVGSTDGFKYLIEYASSTEEPSLIDLNDTIFPKFNYCRYQYCLFGAKNLKQNSNTFLYFKDKLDTINALEKKNKIKDNE